MAEVAAAAAVVTAVVSIYSAMQASDAAGKQAALEQQRLQLQEQQQQLQEAQQAAALQRTARSNRAAVINGAAAGNSLTSTSAVGAINAVGQNQSRELGYLEQGLNLSLSADQITSQQISLNKIIEQQNAITQGIKGVAGGVSDFARSGIFTTPPQQTPSDPSFFKGVNP